MKSARQARFDKNSLEVHTENIIKTNVKIIKIFGYGLDSADSD